ncbi:H-type small acid-soluble spore protein [Siminovitchia acidinfaciens]|uniref:Small, acid-soluble spore protein H n=1 Tax=Siminovitchia acidinfaciens TaxID=2321395 RepID=A0A429Y5C7_9BACI|nr:H-type small acid-soluble spore protein [Siminovitchia acidinfaciens]RST76578.1 H-type small acid-soluble spore protein [Siminovitchia acidinfaciens]
MNAMRAQEIADSPVMANVTLNGDRVYIQYVDSDEETARVYPLDDPSNEQEVHLSELVEH